MSLDTLSEETFRRISKRELRRDAARHRCGRQAGYDSLKLNVVVMRGVNDSEAQPSSATPTSAASPRASSS